MSKTTYDIYFPLGMKNLEQALFINSDFCSLTTSTGEALVWTTSHNSPFSSNGKATLIFQPEIKPNNFKTSDAGPSPPFL